MFKTFRGILADGEEEKIRLSTKKGKIGYRIVKFEIFPNIPGDVSVDNVVQVWKVPGQSQGTGGGATVDFSDANMLAVGHYSASSTYFNQDLITIFDDEVFNQDIFITQTDNDGSDKINYLLHLEVMTLTDNAASVSTLRDIRLNPQVGG